MVLYYVTLLALVFNQVKELIAVKCQIFMAMLFCFVMKYSRLF